MNNRNAIVVLVLAVCQFGLATMTLGQAREEQIVNTGATVLNEVMAIPAKQIPQSLLKDARGVAIIPGLIKGGFVVGARHGRGVIMIRDQAGQWQAPVFIKLTGGSIGFQAGVESTDLVLVFKTRRSVDGLMNGKLTIGVDAAAAAGPVGRQASAATDVLLRAEVLSYSRSRGLFAGVSIDGSALQIDHLASATYYQGMPTAPASAQRLVGLLGHYSPSALPAELTGRPQPTPATVAPPAAASLSEGQVREQLKRSSLNLQALLDNHWKTFLALPGEIYEPNQPVDRVALNRALANFETVARDPRYDVLTQRNEFTATHRLLSRFALLRTNTEGDGQLHLPPPPTGGQPSTELPLPK